MPKNILDSTSRKKDKHSSRDLLKDSRKACDSADEFPKRKSTGKSSAAASDGKSSKKGEAAGYSSGRKRQFTERENCFASEYDDFDDSKRLVHNSTRVIRQHSRNGLVLPGISGKHSLVDYDDESSDSDSSSGSFTPQYPTAKAARRKSSVQVVSASVKADLNEMKQESHKSDTTIVRHVHVSSIAGKKQSSADSVSCDERGDKKKHRHLPAELPEAESEKKDIPVKSAKRRYSKDHHELDKCDDKEYNLNTEQTKCKKAPSVDKPEKTSAAKTVSKEKDSKRKKRLESETEVVVSNVRTEKSKAHKKSKKRELSEEQWSDDDGVEQRSRTNVPKLSDTGAVHKKEKAQKISDDSFNHSKASEKTDRQKKVGSHSDSINGTKVLSHGSSSMQQDGRVSKHSSDDYVHVHKKHQKEKRSSKKKPRAADDSDSNNEKGKKDRSALKHDTPSASCKSDKAKGKKNKDKSLRHSRNEREFSDEGQISSDSSGRRAKESKHKRKSRAAMRSDSSTPVKAFQNASASKKKAMSSEPCRPER